MNALPLALRRAVAQSGLLFTIFAVTVVVSGVLVGTAGYLDHSIATAARGVATSAAPDAAAARIEIKANDPESQAVALADLLAPRFAGTTATVDHSLAIYPLPVVLASDTAAAPSDEATPSDETEAPTSFPDEETAAQQPTLTVPGGEAEAQLHILADDSLPDRTQLMVGEWPAAGGAALNAAAAELFGIGVGDVLLVGDPDRAVSLVVSGLWAPLDAEEPYWMGDPGIATGEGYPAGNGTRAFGPLVVDEATLFEFGITPTARWTIVPTLDSITPAQWELLDAALTGLRDEVRALPNSLGAASIVSGSLATTTTNVLTGLGAIRGVTPVGIALVAVLGVVTLVQLARLLALARRPETALLRSRGASARWLTQWSLVEAIAVGALGSVTGLAAAFGVLNGLFGAAAVATLPWLYAALTAATVIGVLTFISWREAARVSRRDTVDDSGRARGITTGAATVLALAAAAVATWQSVLYGSPLITDASGRLSVNPLAVLAPALGLIAGALLVLLALGPLSHALEKVVARSRTLQPAYSVRQVARGLVSYAAAVLVIALAAGGVVVASAYAASWNSLSERSAALISGADVRVSFDDAFVDPVKHATPLASFEVVDGVAMATRAFTLDVSVGDRADLIAVPAASLPGLFEAAGGAVDGAAIAELLTPKEPIGVPLPADTTALTVDVTYTAPAPEYPPGFPQELIDMRAGRTLAVGSEVWLQDAVGTLFRVELGEDEITTDGADFMHSYRVELPTGVAPFTLEGFDVRSGATGFSGAEFRFENVAAIRDVASNGGTAGEPLTIDFDSWSMWYSEAFYFGGGGGGLRSSQSSITALITSDERGSIARVSPGGDGAGWRQPFANAPSIPIVIDERLAANLSLSIGDDLVFAAPGYTINGNVVALVPVVPGTDNPFAIIADLSTLNVVLLRSSNPIPLPNEVWVIADGSRPLTDIAAELVTIDQTITGTTGPRGTRASTVDDLRQSAFPLPAELSLWIAAAASLALATISLGAVTLTVARSRRGEVGVLRAVGVPAAAQSRGRFIEVVLIVAAAITAGALVGWGVAALTVPGLANSVVVAAPASLTTDLELAWPEGLTLLALAAAAMIAIALVYSLRVRAQALDTDERLETR